MCAKQSAGTVVIYGEVKTLKLLNVSLIHRKCALMKNYIIRPFFFGNPIMTGDNFLDMMENGSLLHVPVQTVLQLDGEPIHVSCPVHAFLDREFSDRRLGRGDPFLGPLDPLWILSSGYL
jgi:hypothetical protein